MSKKKVFYGAVDIMSKGASFMVLPLFVQFMTQEEFGTFELFLSWGGGITILISLGLSSYLQVEMAKNYESASGVLSNIVITNLVITVLLILVPFSINVVKPPESYFYALPIISLSQAIFQLIIAYFMQLKRFDITVKLNLSNMIFLYGASFGFLYTLELGDVARFFGLMISSLMSLVMALAMLRRNNFTFSRPTFDRKMLSFGMAILPHLYSGWIRNGGERVVIGGLISLQVLAAYAIGVKLSMVTSMLLSSVMSFITPYLYDFYSSGSRDKVKKIYFYFLAFSLVLHIVWAGLVLNLSSIFFEEVNPVYLDVFLVSICNSFVIGFYLLLVNEIFYKQQSNILSKCSTLATLSFVVFLGVLKSLEKLDVINIALANLMSSILLVFMLYIITHRSKRNG